MHVRGHAANLDEGDYGISGRRDKSCSVSCAIIRTGSNQPVTGSDFLPCPTVMKTHGKFNKEESAEEKVTGTVSWEMSSRNTSWILKVSNMPAAFVYHANITFIPFNGHYPNNRNDP